MSLSSPVVRSAPGSCTDQCEYQGACRPDLDLLSSSCLEARLSALNNLDLSDRTDSSMPPCGSADEATIPAEVLAEVAARAPHPRHSQKLHAADECWVDPPVRVIDHGDSRGRAVVATRAIPAGAVFFRSRAYTVTVAQEWLQNVCVYCQAFTPTARMPVRCELPQEVLPESSSGKGRARRQGPLIIGCQCTYYCSARCREMDLPRHALECGALGMVHREYKNLQAVRQGHLMKTQARFLASVYSRKRSLIMEYGDAARVPASGPDRGIVPLEEINQHLADSATGAMPTNKDLYSLTTNLSAYKNDEATIFFWKTIVVFLRKVLPASFIDDTDDEVLEVLCRAECNSFGFWDDGEELYSYGVFPDASYFNHSCAPNAYKFTRGRDVFFRALRTIEEGEEVNISYILISDAFENRQKYLSEYYCFQCGCPRCKLGPLPIDQDEFRLRFWHGLCDGFLFRCEASPTNPRAIYCSKCGMVSESGDLTLPALPCTGLMKPRSAGLAEKYDCPTDACPPVCLQAGQEAAGATAAGGQVATPDPEGRPSVYDTRGLAPPERHVATSLVIPVQPDGARPPSPDNSSLRDLKMDSWLGTLEECLAPERE
ncbi:hypothetical protein H696_05585 [Fonticula alba]|uniref:SET domain-containing protein n=1 Tax=Fonticula alba TaxID=691883 RepID=A0A058Z138_FONAL|nr:hypothetical protein H696_05585 [Fonticula alba]KCV67856.1 hypothetical protein H696_05585 [Fonticula alba]|eukprot:XP_009497676.1 hypothetical protein H696_05585 [Fonticula alba]